MMTRIGALSLILAGALLPCELLLNARTVADTGAVNLPLRSPEESALYGLVVRWAAQNNLRTSFPRTASVADYTGDTAFHYAVFRLLRAMDADFCLE